jgi:hypothetical protein
MSPQEPSALLLFGLCFVAALGLIGLLKLNHWWATRDERVNHFDAREDVQQPDRASSAGGSRRVEPVKIPDAPQVEPDEPAVSEPPTDPLVISHKMGRKELTILLAAQRDDVGQYRFSANKIAEFVGGTSAEVKGWVADVRGRKEPAANTLRRPANGWGKAS